MTGVPNYYAITMHVRHQQETLLAEANRDRRAIEAERGAPNRLPAATPLAITAIAVLLALLFAISVATA